MKTTLQGLVTFNRHEACTAAALFERMFPADENGPGATEIGVVTYLDGALAGAYADKAEPYRLGLAALDRAAKQLCGISFADCRSSDRTSLMGKLEHGELPDLPVPPSRLLRMLRDPPAGRALRRPRLRRQPRQAGMEVSRPPGGLARKLRRGEALHRARHQGRQDPVARGRRVLPRRRAERGPKTFPGYDPQRSAEPPSGSGGRGSGGDGGMGGLVAPVLAGRAARGRA